MGASLSVIRAIVHIQGMAQALWGCAILDHIMGVIIGYAFIIHTVPAGKRSVSVISTVCPVSVNNGKMQVIP